MVETRRDLSFHRRQGRPVWEGAQTGTRHNRPSGSVDQYRVYLGHWADHNRIHRVAAGVSCSDGLEVSQVKVESKLAKDAQRWREQMLYHTIVDGEINWVAFESLCETIPPGRSWEAVGHDRIFAACRKLSGLHYVKYDLAPARHTLKMQAFLPATGVVLETDVKLVDLHCT